MYIVYIFWNSNNVFMSKPCMEIALYVLKITLYVILEIVVVWFRKTDLRFLEITPASNRQRSWPSQQPGVSILRSMAGSSEKKLRVSS